MVIAHFDSHSKEDSNNDCSLSDGKDVLNVDNKSDGD